MFKKVLGIILKGKDDRTKNAYLNIIYSFGIKGVSVLTYLLIVPVTLNFLNPIEYGIWLTLSSILMWINTFDIGLGNGLRNKLAEALANEDYLRCRILVSTTYGALIILMLIILGVFWIGNTLIDWHAVLNINHNTIPNLNNIVLMSFALFCVSFVLKLVGNIYLAIQKPAINNMLVMFGQLLALILIFSISFTNEGSLFSVALIYSISPVIVYLIASPLTFYKYHSYLRPSLKLFNGSQIKSLFGLGGQFFILQIGGLIIFSTSNLLISRMFGPENVTTYNIAYRYFSVIPMLFSIVLTPIWSATTDAYVRSDFPWIEASMKKVEKLLIASFGVLLVMVLLSEYVYRIWIGGDIHIPLSFSLTMGLYTYILVISLSYSSFLNGIGKLRLQVINIILAAIIFLPLTYLLGNLYGMTGIVVSLILVNGSGAILNFIQFDKLVKGSAKGLWIK